MNPPLSIQSSIDYATGSPTITCTLRNEGSESVHVLSGRRMPYLLQNEDGSLQVLQGLHAGDPNINYYGVEIPGTVELKPDEKLDFSLKLEPLQLTDHYSQAPKALEITLPVKIQFRVGIVPEAIDPKTPHLYSAQYILGKQTLVEGPVVDWGE